ncbi:MAG: type I-U CRISPR-associated protein Csx17, partial [Actinomycetota bacterium]
MNALRMPGCRPEPLGSYLKSLGVLRLVGEQEDPEAKGSWRAGTFELKTNLTEQGLIDFLVRDYRPTPLLAPWTRGGGFRTDVDRTSEKVLRAFESSTDARLESFRSTISSGQEVFRSATEKGWDRTKDKAQWVTLCRANFPDESVLWIDAVVVLTSDDPVYPPLLGGAGGVLGRMDLSVNFMQNLSKVLALPGTNTSEGQSRAWLLRSVFGVGSAPLIAGSAGQFDPGGGVNSSPLGHADKLINPWDYVLLLEGALLFAGAAARRLSFDGKGKAAMPFMVNNSTVGYASGSSQEGSRGEVWLPLWSRPVTYAEAAHFIGEGRSDWRGRQARTGLDMAKAAASLGVDRGIEGFSRHAFL